MTNITAFCAQYVARCGLEMCPSCMGENGTNGQSWPGRLCQWGSKVLADGDMTWCDILTFYYGPCELSHGPTGGGNNLKLTNYPVPSNNTKFGFHWYPFECADISWESYQWHREKIENMKSMGASWISIISSPGGSEGYIAGQPGCSELTFEIACDVGLMPIVRIFNSGTPPYWTEAVSVLCDRLVAISNGQPFYLKLNNEIDAEWLSATGRNMTSEDAISCCTSIGQAIDAVWDRYNGKVIPSFLNVGYGGQGYNFFQIMHEIRMGDRLDRCWVPVHPYNGAWEIDWPWSTILLEPQLLTQTEYDAYGDYAWSKGTAAVQTLEFVNQKRQAAHDQRMKLTTMNDLLHAYAYGFFTYRWAQYMLDELGHTETPLLFPEWGTRVGETVPGLPAVGPRRHMELTLAMIREMQSSTRILGGGMWFYDAHGTSQNWFDQAMYSPVWDIQYHENMPAEWREEIKTWGQLPLIDYLLNNPIITESTPVNGDDEDEEPEEPMPEPNIILEPANVLNKYDITVEYAMPRPGQKYYKLVKFERIPGNINNLMHNLWVDVLDEAGKRSMGTIVAISNVNGHTALVKIDKPAGEWNDVPINKQDLLTASVDRELSDIVTGIHARHRDEDDGNKLYHFSFRATWQSVTKPWPSPELLIPPEEPVDSGCNLILAALAKLMESLRR